MQFSTFSIRKTYLLFKCSVMLACCNLTTPTICRRMYHHPALLFVRLYRIWLFQILAELDSARFTMTAVRFVSRGNNYDWFFDDCKACH